MRLPLIPLVLGLFAVAALPGCEAEETVEDDRGFQMAFDAAAQGDWFFVQSAVVNGMDVNATDGEGRTLLHYAAAGNQPQVISYLFDEFDPDPRPVDNAGKTPLDHALEKGYDDVAAALRTAGAEG